MLNSDSLADGGLVTIYPHFWDKAIVKCYSDMFSLISSFWKEQKIVHFEPCCGDGVAQIFAIKWILISGIDYLQ